MGTDKRAIDIIVEARMRSSRLPGKVLLPAAGKPLLGHMIERLRRIKHVRHIIIASTVDPANLCIEELAGDLNVPYFKGEEIDVLKRVLRTAQQFETEIIVEITGDNPLIDPEISSAVIEAFLEREHSIDYASNDVGHHRQGFDLTFPFGFSTKVFKTSVLEKVGRLARHPLDREHVVNYLVKNAKLSKLYNLRASGVMKRPELRLTLDTPEDYRVIKGVFEALYQKEPAFGAKDILNFLDNKPELRDANKHIVQQRYEHE